MEKAFNNLRRAVHSSKANDFGYPVRLPKIVEDIKQKHTGEAILPNPTDLDQLARRITNIWIKEGLSGFHRLNPKEIRWLPWILNRGKSGELVQLELLQDLLKFISTRWRNSYLQGLIDTFLRAYDPRKQGIVALRQEIHQRLKQYQGRRASLNKWKEHNGILFNQDGHMSLARLLFNKSSWNYSSIEDMGFKESLFPSAYLDHTASALIDLVAESFPYGLKNLLSFLELPNKRSKPRSKNIIREGATKFLPLAGVEAPKMLQNLLRPFFMKHLLDPRFTGGRVNWTRVPKDAQKIFTTWLSKEDLEIFFAIVDETCEDPNTWKYRRDFWSAYLPYIHFTRVVLGNKATETIRTPQMKRYLQERRPARLKGAGSGQSVFIIGLGNRLFIEWSNSGACRVWPRKDAPFSMEDEWYKSSEFRSPPEGRFIHVGSSKYKWQEQLESWIESNVLRIKPGEFYKLSSKLDTPSTSQKAWKTKNVSTKKRTCPNCGSRMERKTGRHGPFWGCKGYPNCHHTENIRRRRR